MPTVETLSIKIIGNPEKPATKGSLQIEHTTQKERTQRAFKFWGYCWLGAIFAVMIPLVHFVLVPSLILAGPIVFIFLNGQESVILGGEGACPECAAPFHIARMKHKIPFSDLCTACQRSVRIEV